jgi:hypothetical protein
MRAFVMYSGAARRMRTMPSSLLGWLQAKRLQNRLDCSDSRTNLIAASPEQT